MKQMEEYLQEYEGFYAEFFPKATPAFKLDKLRSEIEELADAILSGVHIDIIDETIDTVNIGIKYLASVGIDDPLKAGAEKLRATAMKYRLAKKS